MAVAMTCLISPCALHARRAFLLALGLLFAGPAGAGERPYEIGGAQQELGHTRELAERLSKQNLFYQLHLGDQTKQDLEDTATEVERVLELLREGSTTYSIAAPPNPEIRAQIGQVDKAWGPVRRLALASPYDYLRRANEFVPRQNRRGDPLFTHSFDRMTQEFIVEVDRLMALYQAECLKTDYELCGLAATHGIPTMLNERLAKELVFVYTGPGGDGDADRLRETRDALDAYYLEISQQAILSEATDPARGDAAAFVSSLWGSINEDWGRIRPEIDLAIDGRAQEINLKRVLEIQTRLVETWERLVVVMVRFINAKYAP
jgi:hypothetical protein